MTTYLFESAFSTAASYGKQLLMQFVFNSDEYVTAHAVYKHIKNYIRHLLRSQNYCKVSRSVYRSKISKYLITVSVKPM